MASFLSVLLSLALVACAIANPIPSDKDSVPSEEITTAVADTTVAAKDGAVLVEVIEVLEPIPEVIPIVKVKDTTETNTKDSKHKVAKRSALRGDNPSNDLLANFDGLKYEDGLSSFAGRKIKFLPTWAG